MRALLKHRLLFLLQCGVLFTVFGVPNTLAQSYPEKPVRLIVGFATGGGTDTLARLLSRRLAEQWSQTLVVENRPGADGAIATEFVARAPADGYTLVMISNAHTITPFQRKLNYDPIKDFVPVTLVAANPNFLLVHPRLPVKQLSDLIRLAKTRPGELSFGSSGTGTSPYLAMELLKSMTGIRLEHVPYKGSSPAVIDLMGGHIQLMFGAVSTTVTYLQSGRLRAIAISSPERWSAFKEVPTVAESGVPGFEASSWYGVLAPANTSVPLINKMQADMAHSINTAETLQFLQGIGFIASMNTPTAFSEVIRNDMARWGKLIKTLAR